MNDKSTKDQATETTSTKEIAVAKAPMPAPKVHHVEWVASGINGCLTVAKLFDEQRAAGRAFVATIPVDTGAHVVFRDQVNGRTEVELSAVSE